MNKTYLYKLKEIIPHNFKLRRKKISNILFYFTKIDLLLC